MNDEDLAEQARGARSPSLHPQGAEKSARFLIRFGRLSVLAHCHDRSVVQLRYAIHRGATYATNS